MKFLPLFQSKSYCVQLGSALNNGRVGCSEFIKTARGILRRELRTVASLVIVNVGNKKALL